MSRLPWSPAAERNREPILEVLRQYVQPGMHVLEIGSGSGQHAEYFATHLPRITWQPTELPAALPGLQACIRRAGLRNVLPPVLLDVAAEWPLTRVDRVFTANTAHIMSWPEVKAMLTGCARVLPAGGLALIYGPFSDHGRHTAPSNEAFDRDLRARDPDMGVRDADAIADCAAGLGLQLIEDIAMPANNRILVLRCGNAELDSLE